MNSYIHRTLGVHVFTSWNKNNLQSIIIISLMCTQKNILSMHTKILKSTQPKLHQIIQSKSISSDETTLFLHATHTAMLTINTYGLYRLKAPASVPVHTAAMVLGATAASPEAIFAAGILTTFGFINDDLYRKAIKPEPTKVFKKKKKK